MSEYECRECGAEWKNRISIAYINPVCWECGALAPDAKREK